MEIYINNEIDSFEWNMLVNNRPYFRFEWYDIIRNSYNLDPYFILVKNDDKFALIGSFKTIKGYMSLPFLSHSGFVYNNQELYHELLVYLKGEGITIDNRNLDKQNVATGYVNSITQIDDLEEYWKSLSSNTRNQVRKSQKNGFAVKHEKDVENLYMIYSKNMHRLGTPVHKKDFLQNVVSGFDESTIITIFEGNNAIGSMLCLFDNSTLYDVIASTLIEYNKRYANYFLYWEAIKFLKSKKLNYLDLGRSTSGSGTYLFKQKLRPVNYSIQSKLFYTKDSSLGFVSKVWQRLPYQIALIIGPLVRKYLP